MIQALKNVSLRVKLGGIAITPLLFLFLYMFIFYFPNQKASLIAKAEEATKSNVEIAANLINQYVELAEKGELTTKEAQAKAAERIGQLRFNGKSYFWINDFTPKMVMHPIKPSLNGKYLGDFKDPNGFKLFDAMVKVCKEKGGGIVKYEWPKPGYEKPQEKISYVKAIPEWKWIVGSGKYLSDINEEFAALKTSIFSKLLLFLLVALLVSFLIAKYLLNDISSMLGAFKELEEGNLEVQLKVDSKDELGQVNASFNSMVEKMRNLFKVSDQKTKEAEEAQKVAEEAQRKAEENEKYLEENTNTLLNAMNELADGNLTVSLELPEKEDLVYRLFDNFNKVVIKFNGMIHQIFNAIQQTDEASSLIASSAEQMAAGASEQSAQASEVASGVEEMTATIYENSKNAVNAVNFAKESQQVANEGGKIVEETIRGMFKITKVVQHSSETISQLGESSDKIGEIVEVIEEIADQTNLLALNAAIEAARAGEHGRGFAVVADEVRKLAERTTKATKEIAQMIRQIQNDTGGAVEAISEGNIEAEKGKKLAEKSGEYLKKIIRSSEMVVSEINQLAAATEQQSSAAEQISHNVQTISNVTQEAAQGIHQIAEETEKLNALMSELKDLIKHFKLSNTAYPKAVNY